MFWRDGKESNPVDGYNCEHRCEWQLSQMNETFKTLITVCEEKLQRLHGSDMNLAIIREQLHKEILKLFWYEFQTFQRLHSTRIESIPQFCLEYYTAMDNARHRECKENETNSQYQIQMLLQRHRWLRTRIHRRLQLAREKVNSDALSTLWSFTIMAVVIVLIALFVMVVQQTRNRLTTVKGDMERLEAQLHMAQTQLLQAQASLAAQQEETDIPLDDDNQSIKLCTSDQEIILEIVERNSYLESWNKELCNSEEMLKSRVTDLCFENEILSQECKVKLTAKNNELQNAHTFWQGRLNEERKARKTAEEKEIIFVDTIKTMESKYQWQLAREIARYQNTVNELEAKLKQAHERDAEGEQIMLQKKEELESKVRELEGEKIVLEMKLERNELELDMEREGKYRALVKVSGLEKKVTALQLQADRLGERSHKKSSKTSKLSSSASQYQAQSPQEPNSLQPVDSRFEDLRQNLETRFTQLESKFNNQITRDSKELHMLRKEHQKLCENLEVANKRNIQLERRLAYQEPIQPYHNRTNERTSRLQRWIRPKKRLLRWRSRTIERKDSYPTQPKFKPTSIQDLTDYSYYLSS